MHFPIDPTKIVAFADANWGPQDASHPSQSTICPVSIDETKSACGHIVFVSGGPLAWKSHKEKRISGGSCEAEVKATDECTRTIRAMRHILEDLHRLQSSPTTLYNDDQAAVDWSKSYSVKSFRHYNIHENVVRESQQHGEVNIKHCSGKTNPSDSFTKEHKSPQICRETRDSFVHPAPAA